ncbi:MAG TPA: hypothetical protein VK009_00070 [Chloroflexota bacterium]|nr:hypothetical protein [Chloroflexota bacterium]
MDFDNTIVCYDDLFHAVALERGLIPADLPVRKTAVHNYLHETGRPSAWTELQSVVYGERLLEAAPFPGALEFIRTCRRSGIAVRIVSQKTRYPYLGGRHDLHARAHQWLADAGFYDRARAGLLPQDVYFEATLQDKLERVRELRCDVFVDDLTKVLLAAEFPQGVERVLFDPYSEAPSGWQFPRVCSWLEAQQSVLYEAAA